MYSVKYQNNLIRFVLYIWSVVLMHKNRRDLFGYLLSRLIVKYRPLIPIIFYTFVTMKKLLLT